MNKIILKEKLDLELSLFSGQAFRWEKKLNWYYGFIDNKFLKLRIKNNSLEYVCSDDWVAQDKVYDYFGLGIKYDEIFENFDDELSNVAYQKLQGMRVLNQDPWECLISFIISGNNEQIIMKFALNLKSKIPKIELFRTLFNVLKLRFKIKF